MSSAPPRKRGRPRIDSEAVNVRMERALLDALDAAIGESPEPRPSRPEVVRDIVAAWAAGRGSG